MLLGAGLAVLGSMAALTIAGLREAPYWTNDVWAGGHTSNAILLPPFPPLSNLNLFNVDLSAHARHFFVLGSDGGGRDLLALVARAAIPSLELVGVVVIARFFVGTLIGMAMGFGSSIAREVAQAVGSVVIGFPYLALAAVAIQAFTPKGRLFAFVIGMALVGWRDIAELVAERVEHVRSQSFAVAARALGTDGLRFFRLHVIPFLRPAIGVEVPFQISAALVLLAELGYIQVFLGPTIALENYGGPATVVITKPELGQLLSLTREYIVAGQFWPAIVPALVIAVIALGFELIGTAVRGRARLGG
jgi:ABC-type dipeptide/oligopeptide/nickel transport system permease subunit